MTGFGAAEGPAAGGRLRFEVRTVNHRHLSVQFKLPGELGSLEADLRERLRRHFDRGHVTVGARWVEGPPEAAGAVVDTARARALVEQLRAAGRELGLAGDVDLATLARLPDVVRHSGPEPSVESDEVCGILDRAAAACAAMREREGDVLASDLAARVQNLETLRRRIAERAPGRLASEVERLKAAVAELAGGVAVDPGRLAQEVAFLADRLDITEELVRFAAHLEAYREALSDDTGPVGRRLSFLLQELLREANTIGSKANDAAISESVIAIKTELEKLKEQVENLE